MKKILISLFFICINCCLWSQNLFNSQSVIYYRNALECYDNKNYGKAFSYAEEAITSRDKQVSYEIKKLETSLASRDFKNINDKISLALIKFKERDEQDCINIINSYLKKKGSSYFSDSMTKLMDYIREQKNYPEALKLIADIYKLEGEYNFAEQYYLRALENSDILDVPDEKYAILYTMADLSRLRGDFQQMEVRLLNITSSAQQSKNKSLIASMSKVIKANKPDSVEKLFTMYRNEDYYNLDAYCQLAHYYMDNNQLDKALGYCSLSVVTGFTKMINLIIKRDMSFEYSDLKTFLLEVQNYEDIVKWGNDNKVWESFNLLAKIGLQENCKNFSTNLLKILSKASPESYWQKEAVILLDSLD